MWKTMWITKIIVKCRVYITLRGPSAFVILYIHTIHTTSHTTYTTSAHPTSHTSHQFLTFSSTFPPITSHPTPNSSLSITPHQTPYNVIFNIILHSHIISYPTPYNLIINTISHLIHSPILIHITIFHFLVSISYFLNLIHHTTFPYNSIPHTIIIIT